MSKAVVAAVTLAVAAVGVIGAGLAVSHGWGPFAPEVAFGSDEVLTADATLVLDARLDVAGAEAAPCPTVSMPLPARLSDSVTRVEPLADQAGSTGSTTVRLSPTSTLLVVCLGDIDQVGTPEQIVRDHRTNPEFAGSFAIQLAPVRVSAPFGDAVRWTGSFAPDGNGAWLTDWYIERDGTVLAVGYLRRSTEPDQTALVASMIAGLTWTR